MNLTVSLVIEVEVATEVVAVARVAAADGAATVVGSATADGVATVDGACHPMGILWQLRLQVSPHRCGSNEETCLMDSW